MRIIDADELELWLKRVGKFLKCEEDSKRVTKIIGKIIDHVNNAPTVEANPVVNGKWITHYTPLGKYYECPICGNTGNCKKNFCSSCGCDMRGEKNG